MTHHDSRAWYLGVSRPEVAERALLVGDRGRIERIAAHLDRAVQLNEDRGLRTVTGSYRGARVTAASFGMGAPVAAIVLEELASLGVSTFLRLGTAMALPPGKLGELLLVEGALAGESTSGTYVPSGFPAVADFELQLAARSALALAGCEWRSGLLASYDGFYTEMVALRPERFQSVSARVEELCRLGFMAMDMETSAVLSVGRALAVRAGALCLSSVAWSGPARLNGLERERCEDLLVEVGLETIWALDTTAWEQAGAQGQPRKERIDQDMEGGACEDRAKW